MNILYLTNHLNIGGISTYCLTLAKGFKARGHNVYIACAGGNLVEQFKKEGIVYVPIPIKTKKEVSPKIFISALRLRKFIREEKIDIIHANTRVTQVLAALLQRQTQKPFISTCHGFFKKRLLRKIFPCWGVKVIAISEQVKEHLMKDFAVPEEDIRVIHNGIDVERFRPATNDQRRLAKKNLGLGDGLVIGIVARLSDVKGHRYLIEAMSEVLSQIPNAQLLIVGDGREKEELLALTKRLRVENYVYFRPSVDDTRDVLSAMDLFVLPSLKEGLGLSLMEAMASGLGVIGSDIGGIRSLIHDGDNGLLTRPADSNGLSCAILELLKDTNKRESLGEAARNFIQKNFSQEKMVSETQRIYLECLNLKN